MTTHEPIVKAARELLLTRGFDEMTMNLLASEAGVARMSLYNQFASKEEVLRAVVLGLFAEYDNATEREVSPDEDPEAALRYIARVAAESWEDPTHIAVDRLIVSTAHRCPWLGEFLERAEAATAERIVRLLQRYTAAGALDCPHPLLAARQFVSLLSGFLLWPRLQGRPEPDAATRDLVIDEAVEMFLRRYGRKRRSA